MQHFFCSYGYMFELIFALLTFADKGVRVLAGPFFRWNLLWYVQNIQCVQNSIFPKENILFPIRWEIIETSVTAISLIHHVKFEMWPALYKFPISFSTVKLKLRHNSQFIYRFKTGTSNFESNSEEIKNWDFGCWTSWTSQLFSILFPYSTFLKIILDCTSRFFPIHKKVWKLGFLSSLTLIFC